MIKEVSLEEISLTKGQYGGGFSAIDMMPSHPRYVRITDINEDGTLNEELKAPSGSPEEWEKYYLKEGDLLFARSGATVGKAFLYDESYGKCVYAGYLIRFCINRELAIPKCIHYYTKTLQYKLWVENKQNVVAQPNINAKQYGSELRIPLPPLEEQKKIAAILDAADTLRQKDKVLIAKYEELTQSLFLDMFGDPVTNPKGWEKLSLKKLGKVTTGNTPSRKISDYYGSYIEWIKTDNINTPGTYLTKAEEFLSQKGAEKGRIVPKGSLLVTCIAGSKKVIGNAAISDREVAFNQQINSFTPFSGHELYYYYLFKVGKGHIQSFSTDGMKGMISKSNFEKIDFINTPVTLQHQFVERIKIIEKQKQQAQQSLQKSEELFNSLLQRAFKGELTQTLEPA